uniref:Uncharacterized protein n=1 Tax=Piliocolobus tephrosceles TaxID=591936 RepID=A0A8C9IK20_9PRIM
ITVKSITSHLKGVWHFLSGCMVRAIVGTMGGRLTALQFLRSQGAEAVVAKRELDESAAKVLLGQFGFPLTGTETR